MTTKRRDTMVFMRLDDVTGGTECVVFNATYEKARVSCVPSTGSWSSGAGSTTRRARRSSWRSSCRHRGRGREARCGCGSTRFARGRDGELRDPIRDFPGESPVYVDCMTSLGPKTLA
jgi:hypothetical protein